MLIRTHVFLTLLTALVCSSVGATPSVTLVGNPLKPSLLPEQLQTAYKDGARTIVIRQGTYLLPHASGPVMTLSGWRNATISGVGVTLVLTSLAWGDDCFQLQKCHAVVLNGMTISQTDVPNYQGRVTSVSRDIKGDVTAIWQCDKGYPDLAAGTVKFPGAINVVDADTHMLKIGDGDTYNAPITKVTAGTWRVDFSNTSEQIAPGDWLVGRYGSPPIKIHLIGCRDCTVQNVTLLRNGFAPIREEEGGGNHYLHCIWKPGPMPAGADTPDVVTNAADGMHMTGAYPGPDIENCDFRGVFLDDCIAIHGYFSTVKSVTGNTMITTKSAGSNAIPGDCVRISDENGFFAQAIVAAARGNADGTTAVILTTDLAIPVGAKFSNPLMDGAGYRIIGCHLGDTRSRGILAKADNGLIENNVISHCGMSGVSLGPEYYWGEADYVHHVVVRGNLIQYNGGATYGGPAIWVHGHGAVGNHDITIVNNRLYSNYQGDIVIEWAKGVAISNNLLRATKVWPTSILKKHPIKLDHCSDVTFVGNSLYNSHFWLLPLIEKGNDVEHLVLR